MRWADLTNKPPLNRRRFTSLPHKRAVNMAENDEAVELDPITKLAVELEQVKKELDNITAENAKANERLAAVLDANKRLVAELSSVKTGVAATVPKPDSTTTALKTFKKTLNIEE